MKNKKITIGRLLITLLMLLIIVVGGTYAWLSYNSKKSALVLTIGDINNTKIILKPYEIRETMVPVNTYTSGVYSEVETVNNGNSSTSISLYYKINELDQNLAKGGLKYTITSSTSKNGEYEEVKTGDFSLVDTDDKDALILETKVDPSSKIYYRVYLWLDSSVGDQSALQNTNLNMELNGSITQEATAPVLVNGMIPVVIDNDGTVSTISSDSKNWYDYGNKKWANIVLVNNSSRSNYEGTTGKIVSQSDILGYYVWIPRYRYKIWTTGVSSTGNEEMVNLVFESADAPMTLGTKEGEYRTHPAFWFDGDNDGVVDTGETLAGIWVGKFETTGSNTNPTVLPNASPLINQNISSKFTTSLLPANGTFNSSTGKIVFSDASNGININDSTYGLAINADSHMMKNSEWGAVAYLSRSQYGINDEVRINNYYNSGYKTGCGASSANGAAATTCTIAYGSGVRDYPQSTTGNITGVFDMSGGAVEYVMGNYASNVGNSGFTKLPDSKYYEIYANTSSTTACNGGMCYGHALSETAGWYSDTSQFVSSSSNPWLLRGGNYGLGSNAGVFYTNAGTGNSDSAYRLILITLPTYTVSYNSNTGTGTPSDQIKVYGVDLTLSSTIPVKTNYTFKGWNTVANGSGTIYTSGGTYASNANATLYAVWKDEGLPSASITSTNNVATYQTATLTMSDAVGVTSYYFGKSNPETTSVTWTDVTSSASVTKTQQVDSDGEWYLGVKDAEGNMTVVSKAFYKTTMSIQNGSVSPSTIITMSGNTFTLPTPTVSTNYTFDGWYTASDYSGSAITTHKPTANATIYGKVTANNLSGGSVLISGTNTVGSTLTANVTDTSPLGTYTYQWWTATSANATSGSAISGATASTFKLTSSQVGKYIGVTVTANKTNYFSKTFSDITESTHNTYATVMNLATIPTSANYCNSLTYNGGSQTLTKTAGSGYTFSNNTGTNAGSYTVTATLSTNYIWSDGATGTKTLSCSIATKSVTITAKDQTITQGNSIATGTEQITVTGLVSGHSVTAVTLTPSTTDITTNGIIIPSNVTIKDSSSNIVTNNYNITYNVGKLIINKKVTATLMYYNNLSTTQSCAISSGTTCSITMPSSALASPSGYTFKGWSTSETCDGSTSYVGTSVSLSDNATYYACYSKNVTATFYYSTLAADSNTYTGGGQTSTTASAAQYMSYKGTVANSNYTVPSAVTGSTGGASAQNYAGVATAVSSATTVTPTTVNTTYYAVYTEDLTFYYYNGSSHTSTKGVRRMLSNGSSYSNSLSITEPTPSAYDGASYVAWSYDSSNYGSSYRRTPLETGVNSLYAIYEKTIKVSYNANNGSGAPSQQTGTKYYVSKSGGINTYSPSITISTTQPTRTGYTFSKWNTASDGSGTSYTSGTAYSIGSDLNLYAIWNANSYTIGYTLNGGTNGTNAPASGTYNQDVIISNPTKTVKVTGNANGTGATVGSATSKEQTFAGWTSTTVGSNAKTGTSANPSTAWSGSSTKNTYFRNLIESGTVTMVANWTAVAFNLPTVTKTGYTCGWATTSSGSKAYDSGASYTPSTTGSTSITLYAVCTANSYTIGYTLNGGTLGTNKPTSGIYDQDVIISNPTKTVTVTGDANGTGATVGSATSKVQTFAGWSSTTLGSNAKTGTSASPSTAWSGSNTTNTYFRNLRESGTVTMVANWTAVSFNLPTVTKTGYTCGWATTSGGSKAYDSGASYTTSTTSSSSITLYAVCTANTYTVQYSCGAGSGTPPTTQTVNYDQSITIASNTCSKTGYTFSKWSDPTGDTSWTGWTGTWKFVNGQYGITNNTLTLTATWVDDIAPTISTVSPSSTYDIRNYVTLTASDSGSGIIGYNITTSTTAPSTWIPVVNSVENSTETKYAYSAAWARVFHHNTHYGTVLYSNSNEAKSSSTVDKYSVLGNLENYRNTGGKFEFLLEYPELSGYNRWIQTDNPATVMVADGTGSETAAGYSAVNISWAGSYWGGLTLSTTSDTFINGSVGYGYWFYAIGSYSAWNGGIPGPNGMVSHANLWTRIDDKATTNASSLTRTIGDISSNGTYYVWVKDSSGNTAYKSVSVSKVDTTVPTPTISSISGTNVTLNYSDNVGVTKYYFGTSDPTSSNVSWTSVTSSTSGSLTKTISDSGTYYFAVQDSAGNIGTTNKAIYTISYNANGGSGTTSTQYKLSGQTLTLSSTKPTRTGYTFKEWNTAANGSGTSYASGTSYTVNANATLYAIWTANTYNITYNLDGGSVSGNPSTYNIESSNISLVSPSKTGYTFNGWKDNQDSILKKDTVSMPYTMTATGDNVFTSTKIQIWTTSGSYLGQIGGFSGAGHYSGSYTFTGDSGTHYIRFGANGSTADYTFLFHAYLVNGMKYIFEWDVTSYSNKNIVVDNLRFYQDGGNNTSVPVEEIKKGSYGNKNLTATWQINTYTISYDANGGSGAPSSQTKTYGETLTLSSTIPTKSGYIFLGWSTSSTATSATYAAGGSYTTNSSTTLYAVWAQPYNESILNGADPVLDENGMIPVVISDTGVVRTISNTDSNWYSYANKKWANVILTTSSSRSKYLGTSGVTVTQSDILAYYVWIPRYRYKIWTTDISEDGYEGYEQPIDIVFEGKNAAMTLGTTVGSYRTHPAFWWDSDNDGVVDANETVAGIWVGKFETTGNATTPTVLPDTPSLSNQNISTQFKTSLKFSGGTLTDGVVTFAGSYTYGLSKTTNSHMMKNSEWGAVAYLSHSIYGVKREIYINNSRSRYTGRSGGNVGGNTAVNTVYTAQTSTEQHNTYGYYTWDGYLLNYNTNTKSTTHDITKVASTTGNITGIYDMSGGREDRVMGVLADSDGKPRSGYKANYNSGFNGLLDNGTYYTEGISLPPKQYYDLYTSMFDEITACGGGICYGHALTETAEWYADRAGRGSSRRPWVSRGDELNGGKRAGAFSTISSEGKADPFSAFRSVLLVGVGS